MTVNRKVNLRLVRGNTYDLMIACHAGMITSGTACLEAALLGIPSVIVYRVTPLTYYIGRQLYKKSHFGLPNIIVEEPFLPELLQHDVTGPNMAEAISPWLYQPEEREKVKGQLAHMKERLGGGGAVGRAAEVVLEVARERKGAD